MSAPNDTELLLPLVQRERLLAWSRSAAPAEACGFLLGRRGSGTVEVVEARRARNLAAQPQHAFEAHPEDHLAAELDARARALEVVGAWHSHPRGEARPSELDRSSAWDGWVHLIAGRAGELRAWRVERGAAVEVLLHHGLATRTA